MTISMARRDSEGALTLTNPTSSSSPITALDPLDAEFGFSRLDFRTSQLAGSVEFYQRHVFLCYKNPQVWPSKIEASEFDQVPRLLSVAIMARKADMNKETHLTICEGHDGTETSNGDVLIFPDMIRYRRLTPFDVNLFVEEVLVKNGEWLPGTLQRLKGSYVFVCCHGSQDRRCGVCGPALIGRFKEEIELHGVQSTVSVSPCSHLGGHKNAGNKSLGTGKCQLIDLLLPPNAFKYGYVSPKDVPVLLAQHILKGEIVDWLWRGEMGFSKEEQKKSQEIRIKLNGETDVGKNAEKLSQTHKSEKDTAACRSRLKVKGCCQGNGNSYCCQNLVFPEKIENLDANVGGTKVISDKNSIKELNFGIKSLL
ncbi:hypothetical protein ACB092_06G019600 [Castanea dentata]